MPEINFESNIDQNQKLQQEFEERLNDVREKMDSLFDQLQERGISLSEYFHSNPRKLENLQKVWSSDIVGDFMRGIDNLEFTNKEDFLDKLVVLFSPLIRARVYDAETRKRTKEIEQSHQAKTIKVGKFEAQIHMSDYNFSLANGSVITPEDRILEISLPRKGEKLLGLRDVKESFKEIVKVLEEHQDIKSVVGVSWMMSRSVTDKLGFEKFSDVDLDLGQIGSILDMATEARQDKGYQKGVKSGDVQLGAMSREDFITRYK